MSKKGFPLLFALIALFKHGMSIGATDKVTVSVMEGDSVTLHTGVETSQQEKIKWFFNNTRIAQISGDLSFNCTDVQCNNDNERFRDRLKLDNQTGSLTLINIRNTDAGIYNPVIFKITPRENSFAGVVADSGEYKLVIISNSSRVSILRSFRFNITESDVKTAASVDCKKEISVSVISTALVIVALFAGVKYGICLMFKEKRQKYGLAYILKMEGKSVILDNDIKIETDDNLEWMFGDSLIAQIKKGTGEITVFDEEDDEQFIGRLSLDQTGSLTIMDIRTTDSGYYKLLINRGGKTTFKRFKLTVSGSTEEEEKLKSDEIKDPLMLSES